MWMPSNPARRLARHRAGDRGAPVAALGDIAGVAEALHQLRPGAGDALGIPARAGRLAGEAVTGHRRDHDVECILRLAPVGRRIGQRLNDLQLLDHRTGPTVRDDERQGIRVTGLHVNEMNVDPVDLGHEHWQRVESRLHLAPVVIGPPVADDLLEFPELIALRAICDGLLIGPSRFGDAPAEIDKLPLPEPELWKGRIRGVSATAEEKMLCPARTATPSVAAKAARTPRRGDDDISDMIFLLSQGGMEALLTRAAAFC